MDNASAFNTSGTAASSTLLTLGNTGQTDCMEIRSDFYNEVGGSASQYCTILQGSSTLTLTAGQYYQRGIFVIGNLANDVCAFDVQNGIWNHWSGVIVIASGTNSKGLLRIANGANMSVVGTGGGTAASSITICGSNSGAGNEGMIGDFVADGVSTSYNFSTVDIGKAKNVPGGMGTFTHLEGTGTVAKVYVGDTSPGAFVMKSGTIRYVAGTPQLQIGVNATGTFTMDGGVIGQAGVVVPPLTLGQATGGNGTFTMNGGALTVGKIILGNVAGSYGTLNITGGTITSTSVGDHYVGLAGSGTVIQTGGAVSFPTGSNLRTYIGGQGGSGYYDLGGTGFLNAQAKPLRVGGTANACGTLVLRQSGSLTAGQLMVGGWDAPSGAASGAVGSMSIIGSGVTINLSNNSTAVGSKDGAFYLAPLAKLTLRADDGGLSKIIALAGGGSGVYWVAFFDTGSVVDIGFADGVTPPAYDPDPLLNKRYYTLIDCTGLANTRSNVYFDQSSTTAMLTADSIAAGWVVVPDSNNQKLVFSFTPVPEPATLALLAIGGATMLLRRRRG